jgi:acyl-CoA reductase-like NAD-dependent aldehyde dehydrogenase
VTFLDSSIWHGKACTGGWKATGDGHAPVTEPARDVMRGLELARQIPTGIVHINDQAVDDSPNTPFGRIRASGTGARCGGTANLDAFTDTRWVTIRGDIAPCPF